MNELVRQYQAALTSRMASLADDCAVINAAARPLVGELETPALRQAYGDRALFIGSANGVFTTYVGPADQRVYVRAVNEWVPSTDPCTRGPKNVHVQGVRLVDADGAELMLQVRQV